MATDDEPRNMTGVAALSEAGARASWFVRQQWPKHTEKALQQTLGITEASAERILAGQVSKRLLELMLRAFGWRFAAFVLEPYCGAAPRLDAELLDLKQRLARLEGEREVTRDAQPHSAATAADTPGVRPVAPVPRRALAG